MSMYATNTTPAECTKLLDENDELRARIRYQDLQIERLRGEIEGLRFALRCNGISGGDVKA